jgi:cytoskeletal protein RodZ
MSSSNILFLVVIIVVIVGLVIWIASISARAKRVSAASDARLASQLAELAANPPTPDKPFEQETPAERSAQVIAMAEDDEEALAQIASSTKASRLAELSELHAAGTITDDELAAARAKILSE